MTSEKYDYAKMFKQQPKPYRQDQILEHKESTAFIFNFEIPLPPKKQEKPQKIHPYVKLANQMETKAKKIAQEIIDQRNRCKLYRNILQQQEKKEAERIRNIRNHNQSKLGKVKNRRHHLKPHRAKRNSSESSTQARGPPYWPNVIKMSQIFPKKEQKKQKAHKYSRSRSKYASRVYNQIKRQREKQEKLVQQKQQEANDKMQEEKEAQQQHNTPLQKLLHDQKKEGQQQNQIQFSKSQVQTLTNQHLLLSKETKEKMMSMGKPKKIEVEQKNDKKKMKANNENEAELDEILLKEQMIMKRQQQLKKQKERLQQEKRIIKQRKQLQQEKQELRQARLKLQRRQKQIAAKEASPKQNNKQIQKHSQTKSNKKHQNKRKLSSSSSNHSFQKLDWRKQLQQVTGYNPSDKKYRMRDRYQIKQSNFSRLNEQQKYSRKKGKEEQQEYLKYEKKMKKSYHNHQY